jgi:hypothetical protein
METQIYIRPRAAAEFLKSEFGHGSERGLAKLRSIGGGPPFHKVGVKLVVYTKAELATWARAKISRAMSSTSDREVA